MLVTLSGIVTLVRLVQSTERIVPDGHARNAVGDGNAGQAGALREGLVPILVTGRPLIVLGVVTTVLEP